MFNIKLLFCCFPYCGFAYVLLFLSSLDLRPALSDSLLSATSSSTSQGPALFNVTPTQDPVSFNLASPPRIVISQDEPLFMVPQSDGLKRHSILNAHKRSLPNIRQTGTVRFSHGTDNLDAPSSTVNSCETSLSNMSDAEVLHAIAATDDVRLLDSPKTIPSPCSLPLPEEGPVPSSPTNITPTKLASSPAKVPVPLGRRSSDSDIGTPPKGRMLHCIINILSDYMIGNILKGLYVYKTKGRIHSREFIILLHNHRIINMLI